MFREYARLSVRVVFTLDARQPEFDSGAITAVWSTMQLVVRLYCGRRRSNDESERFVFPELGTKATNLHDQKHAIVYLLQHAVALMSSYACYVIRRLHNNSLSGTIPNGLRNTKLLRILYVHWSPQIYANQSLMAVVLLRHRTKSNSWVQRRE